MNYIFPTGEPVYPRPLSRKSKMARLTAVQTLFEALIVLTAKECYHAQNRNISLNRFYTGLRGAVHYRLVDLIDATLTPYPMSQPWSDITHSRRVQLRKENMLDFTEFARFHPSIHPLKTLAAHEAAIVERDLNPEVTPCPKP